MIIKTECSSIWIHHVILIAGCFLISCEDPDPGKEDCFGYVDDGEPQLPTPAYPSPYSEPSWSIDGNTIVFHRMKVTRISSAGNFSIDYDSTGIWMINADGSDMRLILKGGGFRSPDLSPDGNWLAFKFGGQIYKAPFVNGQIDTTGFVQLTSVGSNHFPAWSPDSEWIVYDNTNCGSIVIPAPPDQCGILIARSDGSETRFIGGGRMPGWSPNSNYIVFIGFHRELFRINISDTTEVVQLTSLNHNDIYATDNRYPKYSPDGSKIAFTSQPQGSAMQIWTINSDGTHLKQLTHEGASSEPSWSPDGRIVYAHYVSRKLDVNNGTLWVMDGDGNNQQQLTFNHGLILDP